MFVCFCRNGAKDRTKSVAVDMGSRLAEKSGGFVIDRRAEAAEAKPLRRSTERSGPPVPYIMPLHDTYPNVAFHVQRCKSGDRCSMCRNLFYRKFLSFKNILYKN